MVDIHAVLYMPTVRLVSQPSASDTGVPFCQACMLLDPG
jgi:hypothetical protein